MTIPHFSQPPTTHSINHHPGVFSTQRLQLAIYLHATQRLPFLRCESEGARKVRFVFEDSLNHGPQAELEFDRGAATAASGLFASQKYLRRKMSEALNDRKIEITKL